MGKIFIESRNAVFGFNHVYVVYRDGEGKETVIRGGPENENFLTGVALNWKSMFRLNNLRIKEARRRLRTEGK